MFPARHPLTAPPQPEATDPPANLKGQQPRPGPQGQASNTPRRSGSLAGCAGPTRPHQPETFDSERGTDMFRNISRAKTAQAVEYVYQDAYAAGDAILQGVAWAELLTEDRYLSLPLKNRTHRRQNHRRHRSLPRLDPRHGRQNRRPPPRIRRQPAKSVLNPTGAGNPPGHEPAPTRAGPQQS